jgi:hypothetical protein
MRFILSNATYRKKYPYNGSTVIDKVKFFDISNTNMKYYRMIMLFAAVFVG